LRGQDLNLRPLGY